MTSGLFGPRSPIWLIHLLDSADNDLGLLDGVTDHSVEIAATERLGGHASFTLSQRDKDIDWMRQRVRVVYDPGVAGVEPWPLGTFLLSSPTETWVGGKAQFSVKALTKLAVIDEDALDKAVTYPSSTKVVPLVVDLIQSTGETLVAATDTGATLSSPMTFEVGVSKLTVVNELLKAIGYWALKVDTFGVFQVQPWTAPALRSPAWDFQSGALSLYRPGWSRTQDLSSVPNRVICATNGTDEKPGFVGIAENTDPASAFSFQNRRSPGDQAVGRWVTRAYDVEAVDQASAYSQAQQRLLASMDPVLKVDVEHALVPLQANDVVTFHPDGDGVPRRYSVQRMSVGSGFDAHVKATWRGVSGFEIREGDGNNQSSE